MHLRSLIAVALLSMSFVVPGVVCALELTANPQSVVVAKDLMRLNDQMVSVESEANSIAEAANAMVKQGSRQTRGYSMTVFRKELPQLTEAIAKLYAENFSMTEMKNLIEFYDSPKGRLMMDFSREMTGIPPAKAGFNEADAKAGMEAGIEFQSSALGKIYSEGIQRIQSRAGLMIEAAHKKARAAGMDR